MLTPFLFWHRSRQASWLKRICLAVRCQRRSRCANGADASAPESRGSTSVLVSLVASVMVLWRHHSNIERLIAGTEPKIGQKA